MQDWLDFLSPDVGSAFVGAERGIDDDMPMHMALDEPNNVPVGGAIWLGGSSGMGVGTGIGMPRYGETVTDSVQTAAGASYRSGTGSPPTIAYIPHITDSLANLWSAVQGRGTYQGSSSHAYSGAPGAPSYSDATIGSEYGVGRIAGGAVAQGGFGSQATPTPDLAGLFRKFLPYGAILIAIFVIFKLLRKL